MSNSVKCFDVVSMVTEEATKQFSPIWRANEERLDILKQYCEAIDSVAEEFGGIAYEVEVDDIEMTVSIIMECEGIIITSKKHVLYVLLENAVQFGFSVSESGNLAVQFVFPSLWRENGKCCR